MNITIYWRTKNPEAQKKIRERFGLGRYMSVNGETPAVIGEEDLPLLREVERRGFVEIRNKVK